MQALDKATELDPNSSLAWYVKGYGLAQLGKHNESIQAYDKAIKAQDTVKQDWGEFFLIDSRFLYAVTWNEKGDVLNYQGKYDEAIKAYEKLSLRDSRFDEYFDDPYISKGVALEKLGRYNESIQAYNKVIEIYPQDAEAWAGKGLAFNALGRTTEANEAIDKAANFAHGRQELND